MRWAVKKKKAPQVELPKHPNPSSHHVHYQSIHIPRSIALVCVHVADNRQYHWSDDGMVMMMMMILDNNDIRHSIWVIAALKTRDTAFVVHPTRVVCWNTPPMQEMILTWDDNKQRRKRERLPSLPNTYPRISFCNRDIPSLSVDPSRRWWDR